MSSHHLAQVDIALPLEPLDSARLAGFVAALAPHNALALDLLAASTPRPEAASTRRA